MKQNRVSNRKQAAVSQSLQIKPSLTKTQKMQNFLQEVESKVLGLIESDVLKMPKAKIPLIERKTPKDELTEKLKQLQSSKYQIQAKLSEIINQQKQLKDKKRQFKIINRSTLEKSEVSHSNKSNIRSRSQIQSITEFEKKLADKTKNIEEQIVKDKKEQQALREQQKKQQCMKKRHAIEQRLAQLQQKKKERKNQFDAENQRLQKIKAKPKLYNQLETILKEKQKKEWVKKMQEMQKRNKEKQIDLKAIRQHEQKYRQLKIEQKLQRNKKIDQYQDIDRQRKAYRNSLQKSKYYSIIAMENQRKKDQQVEKERQKIALIEAAKQYAQRVKRQYIPNVKTKTEEDEQIQKKKGLTFEQTKQKGNRYFQEMKLMLQSKQLKKKLTKISIDESISQHSNSIRYKNYLTQKRGLRSLGDNKFNKTDKKIGISNHLIKQDINDVEKIMKSEDSASKKMQQIQGIAKRLQVDKNDVHLLDKISAKIKILETLTSQ